MDVLKGIFKKKQSQEFEGTTELSALQRRFENIVGIKPRQNNIVEFRGPDKNEKPFGTNFTIRFSKQNINPSTRTAFVMAYVTHAVEAIDIFEQKKYDALLQHTDSHSVEELIQNLNRIYRMHGQDIYKLSNLSNRQIKTVMGNAYELLMIPEIIIANSTNLAFQHLFTADYINEGHKKASINMLASSMGINSHRMKSSETIKAFAMMFEARNHKDLIGNYYATYARVHNVPDAEVADMVQTNLAWGMLRLMLEVDMKMVTTLQNMAQMMKNNYIFTVEMICEYSRKYAALPK